MPDTQDAHVCITGLGVFSSHGRDMDTFWDNIKNSKIVISPVPEHWIEGGPLKSQVIVPLGNVDVKELGFSRVDAIKYETCAAISILAARQALADAGIDEDSLQDKRVGIFVGTGIGGINSLLGANNAFLLGKFGVDDQPERYKPLRITQMTVAKSMINSTAANLGIELNVMGENHTIGQACASGTTALAQATQAIQSGQIDIAIAGGVEYMADPEGSIFRGFDRADTLCKVRDTIENANKPFDENRTGFLMSEGGAGFLVLERGDPEELNAHAEILGAATSFDAFSMMAPRPDGAAVRKMLGSEIERHGLGSGGDIYVNAHGTGTTANDMLEAAMFKETFDERCIVNSTKALMGHTIGASGAFEAIVTALSLKEGTFHGMPNLMDPINDLRFIRETQQAEGIDHAISLSYAFGGHNSMLTFKRV